MEEQSVYVVFIINWYFLMNSLSTVEHELYFEGTVSHVIRSGEVIETSETEKKDQIIVMRKE